MAEMDRLHESGDLRGILRGRRAAFGRGRTNTAPERLSARHRTGQAPCRGASGPCGSGAPAKAARRAVRRRRGPARYPPRPDLAVGGSPAAPADDETVLAPGTKIGRDTPDARRTCGAASSQSTRHADFSAAAKTTPAPPTGRLAHLRRRPKLMMRPHRTEPRLLLGQRRVTCESSIPSPLRCSPCARLVPQLKQEVHPKEDPP